MTCWPSGTLLTSPLGLPKEASQIEDRREVLRKDRLRREAAQGEIQVPALLLMFWKDGRMGGF